MNPHLDEKKVDAIVIAPAWPVGNNGYGIAIDASLKQYQGLFPKVHFICLTSEQKPAYGSGASVSWKQIPIVRQAKWLRFVKGTITRSPAVTAQYVPVKRKLQSEVENILKLQQEQGRRSVIIFEDIPTSLFLPRIRRRFPDVPVAIRSHNVLSQAFDGFSRRGNHLVKWLWKFELAKIRSYEKRVCTLADRVWAISEDDATAYSKKLGICCNGTFGVCVGAKRYEAIARGDILNVIYLGEADLRKKQGLVEFINSSWREVRALWPKARFILAGRHTESLSRPELGVEGQGFLADDRALLAKGQIFINPQEIGSGVKLKSIIAMLAGKALITTKTGVEGIQGNNGEHFLIAESPRDMASLILSLLENECLARDLGNRARELASSEYSEERLRERAQPLLRDFLKAVQAEGLIQAERGHQ